MNILGISGFFHDSSACLVKDGVVCSAVQEERLNRIKGSSAFPVESINAVLQAGKITILDVDYVVFYEKPYLKFERVLRDHIAMFPGSLRSFMRTMPSWLGDRLTVPLKLKHELGYEGKTLFVEHHLAHAGSAFLVSPFEEAAILTVDGVGEWATTTLGTGQGNRIRLHKEVTYPDSLGLLYTAITAYLGYAANQGEGKVMALADFGEPSFLDDLRSMVRVDEDGGYRMDRAYFPWITGHSMVSRKFLKRFGPARRPDEDLQSRHYDMAASVQAFLEETLLRMATRLGQESGMRKLCIAGGVGLNCVANSRLLREAPFDEIFVQPAAGDAGTALGAACYATHCILDQPRRFVLCNAYLGPEFPPSEIQRLLEARRVEYQKLDPAETAAYAAKRIADGAIVGWFQGRMEFGPRALGNRSILADARREDMKDVLNQRVKHREWFRPFGASILEEAVSEYFDPPVSSPFMLFAPKVLEEKRSQIPSAVHVDGTCRFQSVSRDQNPVYHQLLSEFQKLTGVPLVINTSFNDRDEPIVCSPGDALRCFERTGIDCLVLGDFVVEKTGREM